MIDQAKRKTLKSLTAAGVGTATVSMGGIALAANMVSEPTDLTTSELDEVMVKVTHSWAGNDIKVIIKNASPTPTTITQMTPSKISTHLGDLDFDAVMETGPLRLAPGQEVGVHLDTHTASKTHGGQSGQFLRNFQKSIRENVSIVTDYETFAIVKTEFDPQIV